MSPAFASELDGFCHALQMHARQAQGANGDRIVLDHFVYTEAIIIDVIGCCKRSTTQPCACRWWTPKQSWKPAGNKVQSALSTSVRLWYSGEAQVVSLFVLQGKHVSRVWFQCWKKPSAASPWAQPVPLSSSCSCIRHNLAISAALSGWFSAFHMRAWAHGISHQSVWFPALQNT